VRDGAVFGTHWHGVFDNDALRREWLTDAAATAGRRGFVVADGADGVDVTARRDAQLDAMADLVTEHLDVDAVLSLIDAGVPKLPTVAMTLRG
jgi:adenosylcobyric acid synthase